MPGFQSTRCSRVHVASEPGRGPVGEMAQSSRLTEDSRERAARRGPCPRFPSQDIESRPLTLSALLPETWSPGIRPVMAVQAASRECGGAPARIWAWGGAGAPSSPEKSRCWSGGLSCLFAKPGRVWRGAGGDHRRPPLLGLGSSSLTSTSVWTWEAAPWAGVLAS